MHPPTPASLFVRRVLVPLSQTVLLADKCSGEWGSFGCGGQCNQCARSACSRWLIHRRGHWPYGGQPRSWCPPRSPLLTDSTSHCPAVRSSGGLASPSCSTCLIFPSIAGFCCVDKAAKGPQPDTVQKFPALTIHCRSYDLLLKTSRNVSSGVLQRDAVVGHA